LWPIFGGNIESWRSSFDVEHLSVERLLKEWRWLCPQTLALLARSAFGDLYLGDTAGRVLKLDLATGLIREVANSESEFRKLAITKEKQQEWFATRDELVAAQRGLNPSENQCIAFGIPLVFAESGTPNNAYLADLYEYVSFLGEVHRQISELPEGSKVRLEFK
jgi:hypothetical protein